jgi:hypothetical protein
MFVVLKSTSEKQVHLISQTGRSAELPPDIRERGPWKVLRKGDTTRLKLHYRRALAREGYCVVSADAALFRGDGDNRSRS